MIHDVPVYQVLHQAAERWPNRLALTCGEQSFTFAQLRSEVLRACDRLAGIGLGQGDKVVLWCANRPEWVILQFALARLGSVLVTANTALAREDLAYLLKDCDAAVLFAGAEAKGHDFIAVLRELERARLPSLRDIVLLEGGEVDGALHYEELSPRPHQPASVGLDDCINMQYTSGTTGFPKGVMLSSRNIVNNAWRTGQFLGLSEVDRVLCQVPLFHCFGCVIAILSTFTHGASVHLTRTFDPLSSLRAIVRHRVSVVHGVPTMFQALLDHPDAERSAFASLRTGVMAGASCPKELMQRMIDLGVTEMTVGYGLTEASPAVTFTPRDDPVDLRCSSVGTPLPGTEISLVDPSTLQPCERGEVWVRGEQVMLGYYGKKQETREAITPEGWLRTGDLGELDGSMRYRIVGRIKEMIIRGGENVYPAEIEAAIRLHPSVGAVAVFGIPDPRLGEQVACAIIPKPGEKLDPGTLKSFLRERIAKIKVPEVVAFVDAFPMTASGKVQRFLLSQRFAGLG